MRFFGWFRRRRVEAVKESRPGHRYVFTGHDEALEFRTRLRREQAERVRRDARLMETRDQDRTSLRRVK